jgi:hypothetical protein
MGYDEGRGAVPWATDEYTKLKLLESPVKVVKQAKIDADVFCAAAKGDYLSMINDENPDDPVLMQQIQDQLHSAYSELHKGLDDQTRAIWANWNKGRQMALYGGAATSYSTAQLKCQMISTQLKALNN